MVDSAVDSGTVHPVVDIVDEISISPDLAGSR
jgi:hypothetical protein